MGTLERLGEGPPLPDVQGRPHTVVDGPGYLDQSQRPRKNDGKIVQKGL